jgi:uncharacterized protein (TIGR01777 family)
MKVAVTGASGTIGEALVEKLRERGDEVVALSRDPDGAREKLGAGVETVAWRNPAREQAPADALAGTDAVLNLMGAPVEQRWSDQTKRAIRESRIAGTRNLVEAIAAAEPRPGVLVSQSASGWYGARGDEWVDESEPPAEDDFLADVVVGWEREARRAEELGLRVALARTGVVLSESGGALEKMLPFFKLGLGGPVAGGRQYFPWIHLDDEAGALLHLLDTDSASGPVNVCAPEPATNRELSQTLGRVLRRPVFAPVPGLAVRALYGGMAQIVTTGVRMDASRLRQLGFEWRQPELEAALRSATGGS